VEKIKDDKILLPDQKPENLKPRGFYEKMLKNLRNVSSLVLSENEIIFAS